MSSRPFRLTAPVPLERDIHEACAGALDKLLLPPAFWFTYPAGATQLSPQQQARHSRIGLKRGLPDIWILYDGVWLIELKRPGGRLSKTRIVRSRRGSPRVLAGQEDVFPLLSASGAVRDIAIVYSVSELLHRLVAWGLPLRGRVTPRRRFERKSSELRQPPTRTPLPRYRRRIGARADLVVR